MSPVSKKDLKEMKKMFLDEATENLALLEKQIQILENEVDPTLPLIEMYRIIHSFKGLTGMTGITEMEKFFHPYESLISLIQEKKVGLSGDVINLFYESLDVIETGIERIRADKNIGTLFQEILKKITNMRLGSLDSNGDQQSMERMRELFSSRGLEEFVPGGLNETDKMQKVYQISIELEQAIRLKTARIFVIIRNLGSIGTIVHSVPGFDNLMEGNFDNTFTMMLQSNAKLEKIQKAVMSSGEIEKVDVLEISIKEAKNIIEGVEKERVAAKESAMLSSTQHLNNVKVDLGDLDSLLELFGELLIRSKQLERKLESFGDSDVKDILFQMQTYMFSLQDVVFQMQLVPLANIYRIYPRMVRTMAQKENKKVDLLIRHNDVKVDRKLLNNINDILNHILRNAVYHGIETESARKKIKKAEKGKIRIKTGIESNVLNLTVSDDGAGIDPKLVGKAALEKGILSKTDLDRMSDEEIINLVFLPNFSTAKKADLISGRGLGLNIVRQKVENLGGSLTLETELGVGTTFVIQLPISRTLIRALLIRAGDQIFSISLDDIQNLMSVPKDDIRIIENQEYVLLSDQNELLRLYHLSKLFGLKSPKEADDDLIKFVHIKKGDKNFALAVDEFLRESEIVIKSIDDIPKDVKGISGAAILDDGTVSLIINPFSVIG